MTSLWALIYDASFNWLLFSKPVALKGFLFVPSVVSMLASTWGLLSFLSLLSLLSFFVSVSASDFIFAFVFEFVLVFMFMFAFVFVVALP